MNKSFNTWTTSALLATAMALPMVISSNASASTILAEEYDVFHRQAGREHKSVGQITAYTTVDWADPVINKPILGPVGGYSSGTVIGDQWFLTAGHCVSVQSIAERQGFHTISVDGATYVAEEWYTPSEWKYSLREGADIALIKIKGTFNDEIPRMKVNGLQGGFVNGKWEENGALAGSSIDPTNKAFEAVGYGQTGTGTSGQIAGSGGTRRASWNRFDLTQTGIKELTGELGVTNPERFLMGDFDSGIAMGYLTEMSENNPNFNWDTDYKTVLESSIASGDSGGPAYIGGQIVGVTSWGLGHKDGNTNSSFSDVFGFTATAPWAQWMVDIMHGDTSASQTGSPFVTIFANGPDGDLNDALLSEVLRVQQALEDADLEDKFFLHPRYNSESMLFAGEWETENMNKNALTYGDLERIYGADHGITLGYEVPEPTSLALLGLGGLAMLRRRK
ncbi:trypsin-like serine protease [Planctomycetota bacterium]|nr:trypsin-like serine protease [Planctomycetota bacterium]